MEAGVSRASTGRGWVMNRRTYHAAYYRDTAPRRRELARRRAAMRRNCEWLLNELRQSTPDVPLTVAVSPRIQPLRRPVLRLKR